LNLKISILYLHSKIKYQRIPSLGASDALALSDMYTVDQTTHVISGVPGGTRAQTFLNFVKPSKGATLVLFDKAGNPRTLGDVAYDDKVVVTSEDASKTNTYFLTFQLELAGTEAYVTSSVLAVDQVAMTIKRSGLTTTVETLLAALTPAPGASMKVLNESGAEVTSGALNGGFQVKVTSESGTFFAVYNLAFPTGINQNLDVKGISIYPNPTRGEMFIVGLRPDCTVNVNDITGKLIKVYKSEQIHAGRISIDDQPNGIYFVTVKANGYNLKSMRVVKQ